MISVAQYEPVHFITRANSASNPKGLKNVAKINTAPLICLFLFLTLFHIVFFLLFATCEEGYRPNFLTPSMPLCECKNSFMFWLL